MACTISDIMKKDVINTCDASNYGKPHDFELDPDSGRICAIIASTGGILCFGGERVRIPWEKIIRIGDGAILVGMMPSEVSRDGCETCRTDGKRKRRLFF